MSMRAPWGVVLALCLAACATSPVSRNKKAWPARVAELQSLQSWNLSGRAAGAVGTQGWQASLDWQQQGSTADVRLAGPLGVGAVALRLDPKRLQLIDAPAGEDPAAYVQQRLGFAPPFENLRFWLLGVPNPAMEFEFTRNDADRAMQLQQDGWVIDYGTYVPVGADVLPSRFTVHRDQIRVRIAVDHWNLVR